MAVTPAQKNNFVSAFRSWSEDYRRIMAAGNVLSGLYSDLNISTLVDGDLTGDNAGLAAADVTAALSTVGTILGEFTTARRTTINKIGHGSP